MFRGAWVKEVGKADFMFIGCILAWSLVGSQVLYVCTR